MASTSASTSASGGAKDKKVVLFGRTGDGKSTIANVLVTGGLEPVVFESSDAARGCTSSIQKKSGRGWIVTDTVGLGEADIGTIPNAEANEMLKDFLTNVKDEYSHIIYVQKARRITVMEEVIWSYFEKIFKGAEDSFVILITAAEPGWLEENRDKFPEYWKNHNILATDIPPIHRRPAIERRLKLVREQSIAQLERDLDKLFQDRGNRYSIPAIARMNDQELEDMSWSLLDFIISQIKVFFDRANWAKVAAKLTSFVNVTGAFVDRYVLLGEAVRDKDPKVTKTPHNCR